MRSPRAADDLSAREAARIFRRALAYVRPLRFQFAVKLGLTMTALLSGILLPWPAKIILDHVIEGTPVGGSVTPYPFFIRPLMQPLAEASVIEVLLWTIAAQVVLLIAFGATGAALYENDNTEANLASGQDTATRTENEANQGFSLSGGLLGLFEFRWTIRLTQALNHHYRARLFERIQDLPLTAFDDERIGDGVYRLMYDTPSITVAAYRLLLTPIAGPFGLAVIMATVALIYPEHVVLVWGAGAFLVAGFLGTLPFTRELRRRARVSREAGSTTTATVEEGVANVLAVQSLGGRARERERFDRDSSRSFADYRALFRTLVYAFFTAAVPAVILVGVGLLYVIDQVVDGALSLGDFGLLMTYFFQAALLALDMGFLWVNLQGNAAGLQRVFELMDHPGEGRAAGLPRLPAFRGEIVVDHAAYKYPDGNIALDDVSMRARSGEIVALVGPTGAGKTTLAYLIPRFIVPQAGRVLIDGIDLAAVDLDSLRAQVAFVFQETVLFDTSVEENIRVGRPEATDIDIRRAARRAGADEFIQRLPDGYATRLGRGGCKLSVGQRQRLAIARAFVRDAPVLILDEPTSALDVETESHLVSSLRAASRNGVVILIAHRLSTVRSADRILFLDGGKVVEEGGHDELMARPGGAYRRFVELQVRGAA
jgi:ABC-type multidrug transport system fused ATPase/permease subunit